MNENDWKQVYARLLSRRSADSSPDVPVELVQALAEGRYAGRDRAYLLDRVLAHPDTAAEFQFFADLARERPATPTWRSSAWLAAAAAVLTLIAGGLVVRQWSLPPADVLRSQTADPQLIQPAIGARVQAGSRFVWHAFPQAVSYRFELVDEDADVVARAITRDTTFVLPPDTRLVSGRDYVWWVTALLEGGSERRANPRRARVSDP